MPASDYLLETLKICNHCSRNCGVNRTNGEHGFCNTGIEPLVASVSLHKGEEPIISGENGVCNVFFAHCNMACVYCQNHQISRNINYENSWLTSYEEIVEKIIKILRKGINRLGFVSPTHQLFQMIEIIKRLNEKGFNPIIIYNTNGYDNPKVLRHLDRIIDIYLPDIKYYSDELAVNLSDAQEYFSKAMAALKEMVWQKGTSISLDNEGYATSGVIVRHLVLPGYEEDSIKIFEAINEEISNNLNISLMSQYYPSGNVEEFAPNLSRSLSPDEYKKVAAKLENLGFYRGWMQEIESSDFYHPDFSKPSPFNS